MNIAKKYGTIGAQIPQIKKEMWPQIVNIVNPLKQPIEEAHALEIPTSKSLNNNNNLHLLNLVNLSIFHLKELVIHFPKINKIFPH